MGDNGELLQPGEIGEIVIRGDNVTKGYENNPAANADAFTNGWFRTGDQGVMDDGPLHQPHRTAEGDHQPRRREDFAARGRRDPDGSSGRAAGGGVRDAARQARRGSRPPRSCCATAAAADEKELRDFCSQRLAAFKVPRKIVFLEQIPLGATGKLQRIGLAEKLGLG